MATNAGGMHVLRHGSMRAQVLGVEAVLGTGDVVRANLDGLLKDNTGYDLPGLLCGSEGTLGIVTQARLRLVPLPAQRVVALLGFGSIADAVAVAAGPARPPRLQRRGGDARRRDRRPSPSTSGRRSPLTPVPACVLLVELAGEDPLAELGASCRALDLPECATAVADDDRSVGRLWRWREAHPEAAAAQGVVHKADVTVPLPAMADFVERGRSPPSTASRRAPPPSSTATSPTGTST